MELKSASEVRIQDPLSEVTRKERRNLLVLSSIGFIMLRAGIVPSKISALGVDFSYTDQNALINFTGLIALYFLLAFVFYAASDFIAWRIQFHSTRLKIFRERDNKKIMEMSDRSYPEIENRLFLWTRSSVPVSFLRAILEFGFPVVYGVLAVWYLLNR